MTRIAGSVSPFAFLGQSMVSRRDATLFFAGKAYWQGREHSRFTAWNNFDGTFIARPCRTGLRTTSMLHYYVYTRQRKEQMMQRTMLRAGILVAVAAVMATDGSAEARCRSRRANRACCQTANYGVNTPMMSNSYVSPQPACGSCSGNMTSAAVDSNMPSSYPTTVGGSGTQYDNPQYVGPQYNTNQPNVVTQPNATNTVGRPVYDPRQNVNAPVAPAPQPGVGVNQSTGAPNANTGATSPTDPESEDRKASKIPGTSPTKAPAPAANAQP